MENPNSNGNGKLTHIESCGSVFLRSIYDKSCPRCALIGKVIYLRRRNVNNGASEHEAATADRLAEVLIVKHGLVRAELIDRLYISVTNKIVHKPSAMAKRGKRVEDIEDLFAGEM